MNFHHNNPWPALVLLIVAAVLPLSAEEVLRPSMVAGDPSSGCPSVEGAFIALLNPERGMLLLSAAPFPGGRFVGEADGSKMRIELPGTASWDLDHAGSSYGQVPLWGARYPFLAASGAGCVGFDKQFWSSEGDLVTYLRWLVEEVYFQIPIQERRSRADFRLADRRVSIRVQREGYGPLHLSGKEGATLACRYDDSGRIYLFMPFVLDEPAGRIAVKVASTDGSYFDQEAKTDIGWVVAAPDAPGTLADTSFTIAVETPSDK